jgi:putative transposase
MDETLGGGEAVDCECGDRLLSVRGGVRISKEQEVLYIREGNLSPEVDVDHTGSFDAVFAADGIETLKTAPRAPRMNAHCERIIGTLRREALDQPLIWNETHARRVLDTYAQHYNQHRPHQARGQLPPLADEHPAPVTDPTSHRLLRTRVLGGIINEYRYAA